jgi:hypothetical protein
LLRDGFSFSSPPLRFGRGPGVGGGSGEAGDVQGLRKQEWPESRRGVNDFPGESDHRIAGNPLFRPFGLLTGEGPGWGRRDASLMDGGGGFDPAG